MAHTQDQHNVAMRPVSGSWSRVLPAWRGDYVSVTAGQNKAELCCLGRTQLLWQVSPAHFAPPAHNDATVLYWSGYTDRAFKGHDNVSSEDIAFMSKPFSPPALTLKVREVLDS